MYRHQLFLLPRPRVASGRSKLDCFTRCQDSVVHFIEQLRTNYKGNRTAYKIGCLFYDVYGNRVGVD